MKTRFVSFLIAAAILTGCSTFPSPTPQDSTLVIGLIVLEARGYENFDGATVNGTHGSDIEISVENLDSGQVEKWVSHSGFFYSEKIEPGHYRLKRLSYTSRVGNSRASIFTSISNGDRDFDVIKNQVNNLGRITWHADSDQGMRYWLNQGYRETADTLILVDKAETWREVAVTDVVFRM